jgi:ubiquinone/menaquinone biosynthesis C-methylase UbiE
VSLLRRWFARTPDVPEPPALTPDLARQIRHSFEEAATDEEHFPSTIDPRIQHVRLIAEYLAPMDAKRVLDLGAAKGRFAKVLCDEAPGVRIAAVDVAVNMLRYVPTGIAPCAATMNALPFADAAFDAAYATESLEHAVDIERAVAELCRVVKPGGRMVVIDKNAEHWGKLQTPEWERWFTPRQMEQLLGRHCRSVRSQPISYWAEVEPDGMFYAWLAER